MSLVLLFALTACQTFEGIKTRDEVEKSPEVTDDGKPKQEVVGEIEAGDVNKKIFNINDENIRPRLGIILGPGMSYSLAHLGVLKALNNQKIPVEVIAGIEWSSLVSANYAINGAVNDMIWKASQGQFNVTSSKGFLRGEVKEISDSVFTQMIDQYTRGRSVQNSKIKFICPSLNISTAKVMYFKSGNFNRILKGCMKAPPLAQSQARSWAMLWDIDALAAKMKQMGAQKVIFVNVLPQGGINWGENSSAVSTRDKYLWAQVQAALQKPMRNVDHVLRINTKQDPLNFKEARLTIQQSSVTADQFFKNMARQYSF